MDENLPLILLVVSLVVIVLIMFGVHRKKRQSQIRADMYRQWRDYPGEHEGKAERANRKNRDTSADLGAALDAPDMEHILDDVELSDVRVVKPASEAKQQAASSRYADLVVLYVMARPEKTFAGYELLQALSVAGLQYGEMNIFHHYLPETEPTQKKRALFSLASATEPGTFDLSEMGGVQCSGLCLFMDIKQAPEARSAFEQMLNTAKQLADDLDGVVQDQRRQAMTEQGAAVYRARIRSSTSPNSTNNRVSA